MTRSGSFALTPALPRGSGRATTAASPEAVTAFALRLDEMNRQVSGAEAAVGALLTETGAIKETLLRSSAPVTLRDSAHAIERELLSIQQKLSGNQQRALYGDAGPVSVSRRIEVAVMGTFRSTYGPTPMLEASLEIAEQEFSEIRSQLRRITDSELPALRGQLDEAGVPWTPGRGNPGRD